MALTVNEDFRFVSGQCCHHAGRLDLQHKQTLVYNQVYRHYRDIGVPLGSDFLESKSESERQECVSFDFGINVGVRTVIETEVN